MSYVAVGKVIGPCGQEGWVRVAPLTDFLHRFSELKRVFVSRNLADDFPLPLSVEEVEFSTGRVVIAFRGVTDTVGAQELTGSYLLIPDNERFTLPEDRYYIDQLIGLEVIKTDGANLGQVVDVLTNPGNDLLLVRTAASGELLLPMVKAFIHQVDLAAKTITVSVPPGLEEL